MKPHRIINMSDLLIIGNGFDRNLGLKTDYSDFIKSPQFLSLINQKNELCIYLESKHELQKWIDIENEFKTYSSNVFLDNNRDEFKKDYLELCDALCQYINSIDYDGIDRNSDAFIRMADILEKYELIVILDFNYTESIKNIIDVVGANTESIRHIRVHGSAKEKNIIFGVEDDAKINPKDVFLLKSYHDNYCIKVKESLELASSVFIYGHSLGETDHSYFGDFFKRQVKDSTAKKISITYYGDRGKDDIFEQLSDLTMSRIGNLKELNQLEFIPLYRCNNESK